MSELILYYEEDVSLSKYLHSEWIQGMLNDCDNEALEVRHIKPLQQESRTALWNICNHLGLQSFGVPGRACQILERYLHTLSVTFAKTNDPTLRDAVIKNVQNRLLLIITCCVLLAAKMNSASTCIHSLVVRICLLCKGIKLSVKDINNTELDIYTTIKCKIPLWSSVDTALFLASELKLYEDTRDMSVFALIVDLAEYYKGDIENEIRKRTCLPPQFRNNGGSIVRTLHLAAGAVAAASQMCHTRDISCNLASLTKVPAIYIQCLRDIIVTQINSGDRLQNNKTLILKRKRNIY